MTRAPGIDLLIMGIVMISLSLLKGHVGTNGCIYRKWLIDVLEAICYINIVFFVICQFLYSRNQTRPDFCGLHLRNHNNGFIPDCISVPHVY